MKFDFKSLTAEPLIYMLMHSGAFVCLLGFVFFFVGLLFGYATWGRFKRQTRELRGEAEAMKDEIAGLKRKVGDHSVKPGPTIAMATETIQMPKKEGATAAEAVPAVTEETITTRDIRLQPSRTAHAPANEQTSKSPANAIKGKAASQVASQVALPPVETIAPDGGPTPEPPPSELTTSSAAQSPSESLPPPARHFSPLASIIATLPAADEDTSSTPADTIPALIELPITPLPAVEIHPELDPKLGLVYKAQPQRIDDLTALKGIAQVLAQRLHEFGIYTYAQIAAWDDDQIKEFSSRLAFKDRIQREHWVEQAKQLAAKPTAV
jgi:predicted flap endonuclease-1-like 5' DNA nuclease